jgi:pyruvate,water dikinase
MAHYIRWFEELRLEDVPLVGGKNASLGEMYRELTGQGVRVPNGFAVTAQAFRDALAAAGAWDELHGLLDGLDKRAVERLAEVGARCREIVYAAGLPAAVRDQVLAAYRRLGEQYWMPSCHPPGAARIPSTSSATRRASATRRRSRRCSRIAAMTPCSS